MALQLELYIEGERVDLYKDEVIQLTSKIKDVKEIGSVFSNFTQEFNLPASDVNNEIFKHYYNYNVLTNTFDARYKVEALIKVNGIDYRVGKLRLSSAVLNNQKPVNYKCTFFGNSIKLNDLLGDDNLSSLPLSQFTHDYSVDDVQAAFEEGLELSGDTMVVGPGRDIVYPFISTTNRYIYASADSIPDTDLIRNMSWDGLSDPAEVVRGLKAADLKPAIRLIHIIEAIETKYGFTFSRDFLDTAPFKELYMWLHNNAGAVSSDAPTEFRFCDFDSINGADWLGQLLDENCILDVPGDKPAGFWYFRVEVIGTPSDGQFTLRVIDALDNNQAVGETSGTGELVVEWQIFATQAATHDYRIQIINETGDITDITPTLTVALVFPITTISGGYALPGPALYPLTQTINMSAVMPDMKVIDFMKSLFKMFNLTAYVNENKLTTTPIDEGGIYIQPLQDYYNLGETIDLTRYVTTENVLIERLLPHKEIEFIHSDPETFLIKSANAIFGTEFGNLLWNESLTTDNFDGNKYVVESGFEHMLFEKLTDLDAPISANTTNILYGWSVDDKQEPTVGAPLIFYNEVVDCTAYPIKFETFSGATNQYNRPSNTLNISGTTVISTNFGNEADEFRPTDTIVNQSLFNLYHSEYIRGVFSEQARKITTEAVLPPHILLAINLNDTIIIANRAFKIEEMKTNLITGKSDLILTNITPPLETPLIPSTGSLSASVVVANNEGVATLNLAWTPGDYSGSPMKFNIDGDVGSNSSSNSGSWDITTLAGVPPREREIQIFDTPNSGVTSSVVVKLIV
tara:strand:- start:27336 stop:29741 length:2406 start_codon:yes stop_codon:yes gene_type:complete